MHLPLHKACGRVQASPACSAGPAFLQRLHPGIWYIDSSNKKIYFVVAPHDDSLDIDTEDTYCSEQIIGTNPAKLYIKRDKCSSSLVISLSNETLYIQGNLTEFEILKIANSVHSIF